MPTKEWVHIKLFNTAVSGWRNKVDYNTEYFEMWSEIMQDILAHSESITLPVKPVSFISFPYYLVIDMIP